MRIRHTNTRHSWKRTGEKEIREGLIRACGVIDLIIAILRGSKNLKDAKSLSHERGYF